MTKIPQADPEKIRQIFTTAAGAKDDVTAFLPYLNGDATAGVENELQASVKAERSSADLVRMLTESGYYRNLARRTRSGDSPRRLLRRFDDYMEDNPEDIWENSWLRFPKAALSPGALKIFLADLSSDKSVKGSPPRGDISKFFVTEKGEEYLRLPISYILKLALADAAGIGSSTDRFIEGNAGWMMEHFLNDNTSPETFSFYPAVLNEDNGYGFAAATETAIRYLLIQLLTIYANDRFRLTKNGQNAMVYFAPHPPVRQKELNDIIPDSFYREIFMSPCLSGWERGEEKYQYMQLCHQVLSRSGLNTISKLREAGITFGHLAYLRNISNVSLANNGTHISLGSRRITSMMRNHASGFGQKEEKYAGDLVIKIMEHFLPLFVGTYSAAPCRIGFQDFHPESALGFLPHELDFTHLRMIWRRWKKKADIRILGWSCTPTGMTPFDIFLEKTFRVRGDYVPDYRLVDYFACLMSTDESPALNGIMENTLSLKKDLANMGIFDERMSVYLLYKMREFRIMGFSGFEGRYYSQFHGFGHDMAQAINLQVLLTALAWKYVLTGAMTHSDIPDSPVCESERRQIFFDTAIGIPTFYISRNTGNAFLKRILSLCEKTRSSNRYPGYIRIYNTEYRQALLRMIREDAADILEERFFRETLSDLEKRITLPAEFSAAGKLTSGILSAAGTKDPMKMDARDFNLAAESYYREGLRKENISESLEMLKEKTVSLSETDEKFMRQIIKSCPSVKDRKTLLRHIASMKQINEGARLPADQIRCLIGIIITVTAFLKNRNEKIIKKDRVS